MEFSKLKRCLNIILAIVTTYVLIWYLITPSTNECQMTFMMEPPKFIPVPIETDSLGNDRNYKLFMYSEFGFPLANDIRRDLRDSMPVLFVPGNAGSYQQVRSLASTCIRHQLQSLDASKFIFYTIDFRGQLSGIDGQLLEEQTAFVHRSLDQILKLHPVETKGVIMIGHSVGGFILKALFAEPDFDHNSVPLLISLASPLTKPYLTFDDRMRHLYLKTNKYWYKKKMIGNHTIAISISGGKSDRLVPMHLSMDPSYDISLTTSSMRDVWLATDHVCITWCRELMQKLARLLSSLMDRKSTRLISNRDEALATAQRELLVAKTDKHERLDVINEDWKTTRPYIIYKLGVFQSFSRAQFMDNLIILDISGNNEDDILIFISHLGQLREKAVFGCQRLKISDTHQINCVNRTNLEHLALKFPSRKFGPKTTAIKLIRSETRELEYITFDFMTLHQTSENHATKIPETISAQPFDDSREQTLYVPSLFEYIFNRLLSIENYHQRINHENLPLSYVRYKVLNLKQRSQVYTIKFLAFNCGPKKQVSNDVVVLRQQNGYISENSQYSLDATGTLTIDIKIESQEFVLTGKFNRPESSRLELFMDGSCENHLSVELNLLDLIVSFIQRSLGKILACSTFLAYRAIVLRASMFKSEGLLETNLAQNIISAIAQPSGYIFVYLASEVVMNDSDSASSYEISSFLIIYILSAGVVAYLGYFVKLLIDLALITNKVQSWLSQRISRYKPESDNDEAQVYKIQRFFGNFDWVLIALTLIGSSIISIAITSLVTLFVIIKTEIVSKRAKTSLFGNRSIEKEQQSDTQLKKLETDGKSQDLLVSLAVLSSLTLILNIPSTLVKINNDDMSFSEILSKPTPGDKNSLAATISLPLTKLICMKIDSDGITHSNLNNMRSLYERLISRFANMIPAEHAHIIALTPIVLVEYNVCYVNLVLLISLTWLNFYLPK